MLNTIRFGHVSFIELPESNADLLGREAYKENSNSQVFIANLKPRPCGYPDDSLPVQAFLVTGKDDTNHAVSLSNTYMKLRLKQVKETDTDADRISATKIMKTLYAFLMKEAQQNLQSQDFEKILSINRWGFDWGNEIT